jgi:hypothetical protein
MKTRLMLIASALLAALIGLPAGAQPGPGMAGGGGMNSMAPDTAQTPDPGMTQRGGMGARALRDCSRSANPTACTAHREARAQAHEACKDSAGAQRRQCMHEQMQNFDCAKTGNPQRCESRKMAYQECRDQAGPAFRQCVQQKMPPVDCRQAPNQARCEQHQKARDACKDKLGAEHKACLHEQFKVK